VNGFLLDTNVPSELTHSRPDEKVRSWFTAQPAASLYLSVITLGELRRGFALLPAGKRRADLERWFERSLTPAFQGRILPVTQAIAERWGVIDASAKSRGIAVKIADGLIAATAIEHGLTLATRNVRDFVQWPVKLHNPWPESGRS
jgi:toxin FitB